MFWLETFLFFLCRLQTLKNVSGRQTQKGKRVNIFSFAPFFSNLGTAFPSASLLKLNNMTLTSSLLLKRTRLSYFKVARPCFTQSFLKEKFFNDFVFIPLTKEKIHALEPPTATHVRSESNRKATRLLERIQTRMVLFWGFI